MKRRILTAILAVVMLLGMLPGAVLAASTEEEALGEVQIYNGEYRMAYLSMNGIIREQIYTYHNFVSSDGTIKEIPAYCVNPTEAGVPQVVAPGESIKYMADEKASDPKITGIVANGYPTRSLEELGLENKYHAYYATKMALWCYLRSTWNINNLQVNPNLTGVELQRAQKILAAAKDIYRRGTAWTENLSPNVSCSPDRELAYPVTISGRQYKQQVFTFTSKTWVCNYTVNVGFSNPAGVPAGTRIVNMDNQDITKITTSATGDGYAGQFKVLYPMDSVQGQNGNVQLSFSTNVYQYAIFYAVCAETSRYGQLQNYMVDTDPTRTMQLSAYSNYGDEPEVEMDTGLEIVKYKAGTTTPLSGAMFEVISPSGDSVGTFSTNSEGKIRIPLKQVGSYTVTELQPPAYYLLSAHPTQHVTVNYGSIARVVIENEPYGTLRIEKTSDTGMNLPGAMISVTHIESGRTYTQETNSAGCAIFSQLRPGAYRIQETAAPAGWQLDSTIHTVNVAAAETTAYHLTNAELPGLRIIKYDRKHMLAMPDVTFEVFKDAVSLGTFRTDQFGEILLTDVQPGTYRAVEVDTGSSAHILCTTPQEVELEAGDGIKELLFFNDVKPGLHLVKVDSTDPSRVIPNAVFEIKAVDGSFGPEEFTTDAHGEIDLSELPTGAYVVTEKSCPGYVIDNGQRIIQLDANEDAQFCFTNSIRPSLEIIKLSADGSVLPGVVFRIAKIADGSHYLDRTTNAQGEILIADLEPGVYSVKETATTANHIIDLREYHVELFPGRTSTLVIENQIRPNLFVFKHDADTGEPVKDTVFQVKAADGHSVDEIRTDADGKAMLTNLLPGVYEVKEKSVPAPYLLDALAQLVTLYPNRDHSVYFENHQKPNITVHKVCSVTGEPLQGAKFKVTYAADNSGTGEINDLGTFYTDENGQFRLESLRSGWYSVTELESVPGYAIREPSMQQFYLKGGESKSVTFENTPLSALIVYKFDSVTGEAIQNALFQVKYLTGPSGTGGTVIDTRKTGPNGSFTLTGLKAGTYIVEELASDSGHVIDTAPQTAYFSGAQQDIITLFFGNSPKGSLLVKKIDSVTHAPLSDVEFLVTTSNGTLVGNANGKFKTDSAGTFLIDDLDPGATLVVKETHTKSGYLLDDTPQTLRIRPGQTVSLEFRNQPEGNLIINKLDSVTGKPLEGVEFRLTYADGCYVDAQGGQLSSLGLYRTDKNGQIRISNVTGTIVVTETRTVPGYTIDENTRAQTVAVNPNDTQTLTFYNDPIGGLRIIKSDADSGARISGVKFEIAKLNGETVGAYTTDRNGVIYLPEAESGWYTVTEIKAAEGYKLDATPGNIEVRDGQTATLELTNEKIAGIAIHKTDANTGEGIYGVTFIIYDNGRNPVDQITTDQYGYAYSTTELSDGRYYIRELEPAEGYLRDDQYKSVQVRSGRTTTVEWENTPVTGQIQVTKYAAEPNSITGQSAGTVLKGATYEIVWERSGKVVGQITTDARGVAASKPLPLGRYILREIAAPAYWQLSSQTFDVTLEYPGQIIKLSAYDKPAELGVTITKTGIKEVLAGSNMSYSIKAANTSNVPLESFFWHDRLPTDVCSAALLTTGTYNARLTYRVIYKTNYSDYRVLASNLLSTNNYSFALNALPLMAGEVVTDIYLDFGKVPVGFQSAKKATVSVTVSPHAVNGYYVTNCADAGGKYAGTWQMANASWISIVRNLTPVQVTPLPKTGY